MEVTTSRTESESAFSEFSLLLVPALMQFGLILAIALLKCSNHSGVSV
jgi:hypothetical protein